MSGFRSDYEWQRNFLDPIRNIVGPLLLKDATFEEDTKEATDMLVLKARDMRIGCRVRRAAGGYANLYPWQFTIRSRRDSGAATELEKITNGWGDWMFYGHAEHDGPWSSSPSFSRWFVIDLAAWRAQMIRSKCQAGWPTNHFNHSDGTHFKAFDVRGFVPIPNVCVACSHEFRLASPEAQLEIGDLEPV